MNFARELRRMKNFRGVAELANIPQLKRGVVWCVKCDRSKNVNAGHCLTHGWPKCCEQTMTLDSPEERAALATRRMEL